MLFVRSSFIYLKIWQVKCYPSVGYSLSCQYLQVTQATNQIVMNCADIDIITASFVPQGGEGEWLDFL